jgi:hypothetical protein
MEQNNNTDYNEYFDNLNEQIKNSYRSKNLKKRILKIYMYMGVFISIIGIIYFIATFIKVTISTEQRMALIIGGVGLLTSLLSKFLYDAYREEENELVSRKIEMEKITKFIIYWNNLERALNLLIETKQLSDSKFTIGKNLDIIHSKGIITTREFLTIENALSIRNTIMHGKIASLQENIVDLGEQIRLISEKILDKI